MTLDGAVRKRKKRETYAEQACVRCRRRKSKCVWTTTSKECERCAQSKQSCTLNDIVHSDTALTPIDRLSNHDKYNSQTQTQDRMSTVNKEGLNRAEAREKLQATVAQTAFYPLPASRSQTVTPREDLSFPSNPSLTHEDDTTCRFGRPQWRFKHLILRTEQFAHTFDEQRQGPLLGSFASDALSQICFWNPFIGAKPFDSSFLQGVIDFLLHGSQQDERYIQQEAKDIVFSQNGGIEEIQGLLLLALYHPPDLLPTRKKTSMSDQPPGLSLLTACRSMLGNNRRNNNDIPVRLTTLSVYVTYTLLLLNREPPTSDLMEEVCEAELTFGDKADVSIHLLKQRVRLCNRVARAWREIYTLDLRAASTLGDLYNVVERCFCDVNTVLTLTSSNDDKPEIRQTINFWLRAEANEVISCFAPRIGWLLCKNRYGITPTAANVSAFLTKMSPNDREMFGKLNALNGSIYPLGPLSAFFLRPHLSLIDCAPTIFTLSRALAAAEGEAEMTAALVSRQRRESIQYDSKLGVAAHIRLCASKIRGNTPTSTVTKELLETFASIIEQMLTLSDEEESVFQPPNFSVEDLLSSDIFNFFYSDASRSEDHQV